MFLLSIIALSIVSILSPENFISIALDKKLKGTEHECLNYKINHREFGKHILNCSPHHTDCREFSKVRMKFPDTSAMLMVVG